MPTFDIVSKVESMEIKNAISQADKEIANRYDFKGSDAKIELSNDEIKLSAKDQQRIQALYEVVISKLAKRNISLKNVEQGELDVSPLGHSRQVIKFQQGIPGNHAKDITAKIRAAKLKVTASIQGDLVRVTGKSRDDLQNVIGMLRGEDFPIDLAFENFRN